jgi:hypothetical protein
LPSFERWIAVAVTGCRDGNRLVDAVYRIGFSTMKVVSFLRHAVASPKFSPGALSRAGTQNRSEVKYFLMKPMPDS